MESDTLILVHCMTRHGHRTPDAMTSYPNDPYKHNDYYPYGPGNLTNQGKEAMYHTGIQLRHRYDSFLGDLYFPEIVEAWATDFARTRASAELVLAGLFPPKGCQVWNDTLDWQPIPVNYTNLLEDQLLGVVVKNQKYLQLYAKNFQTEYGKSIMKRDTSTVGYLEEHAGMKITSTRQIGFLRDIIKVQLEFGLEQPEWTKAVYPHKITELVYPEFEMETYTKEQRRMLCGCLFKKILGDSLDRINEKSKRKICIYSGHDINLAHFFIILNIFYRNFPNGDWVFADYASLLTFELHKIDGRYGFKLFFKKNLNAGFEAINFSSGQEVLWIDEFQKIVNDLWSDD